MYSCCVLYYFILILLSVLVFFFFFNDPATTEIYTLSLHDALPIYPDEVFRVLDPPAGSTIFYEVKLPVSEKDLQRSEEHTSELQSRQYLVCRLLLEKKKKT